jgi:hypothetical protein
VLLLGYHQAYFNESKIIIRSIKIAKAIIM